MELGHFLLSSSGSPCPLWSGPQLWAATVGATPPTTCSARASTECIKPQTRGVGRESGGRDQIVKEREENSRKRREGATPRRKGKAKGREGAGSLRVGFAL
jgi:hypothetical protein